MLLKVSDIKQYLYCPRVIYFTYVLPVEKKVTAKMIYGKEEHFAISSRERRRKFRFYDLESGEKYFNVRLYSSRLELEGILDMYLATPRGNFPVDYKNTCRVALNHKYQLIAYVLLLEEHLNYPVRGGFVYLIPRRQAFYIEATSEARLFTRRLISAIRHLIVKEYFPPLPRRQGRCTDCEYRNFCGDVG